MTKDPVLIDLDDDVSDSNVVKGPVVIDLADDEVLADVSAASPVPDFNAPKGQAVQSVSWFSNRRSSTLSRWFWGLAFTIIGILISLATWDYVNALLSQNFVLGWIVTGLMVAFVLVSGILILREITVINRLSNVFDLRRSADEALAQADLSKANKVIERLLSFYKEREETKWGCDRLSERRSEQLDASNLLVLAEMEVLVSLDAIANREVEKSARQIATLTAVVPLPLVDVLATFTILLRMIRRIAEVYGGRSGILGSRRLIRAIFAQMVVTGALSVGDELVESVLGGTALGKISRRLGEGIINGALSVRVGITAMELCRPLPFSDHHKPSTRSTTRKVLTGIFSKS